MAFPVPPIGLVLFFAGGAIMILFMRSQAPRRAAFWNRAASVLDEPEFGTLDTRIRFPLLGALFFTVSGGIATIGCSLLGSPAENLSFSRMPLAVGLGMLLGLAFTRRSAPRRSA